MGTHGSLWIHTPSRESDDPALSTYLVKLHATHDGGALDAFQEALRLPFQPFKRFESACALAMAQGSPPRSDHWQLHFALSALLWAPQGGPHSEPEASDPDDRRAFAMADAFERCRDSAQGTGHFSSDPTELASAFTGLRPSWWFALPHQLSHSAREYWDNDPDLIIESGEDSPLTRVRVRWDPEESEERKAGFERAARQWVEQLNEALSPFCLYEVETDPEGLRVSYPFELVSLALVWHRGFAGGRCDPLRPVDEKRSLSAEHDSATLSALGADPFAPFPPSALSELAFCFPISKPSDRGSVWSGLGRFQGANRPATQTAADRAGALIALGFLDSDEPHLDSAGERALTRLCLKAPPGELSAWLASLNGTLGESGLPSLPRALSLIERMDLNRVAQPAPAAPKRGL